MQRYFILRSLPTILVALPATIFASTPMWTFEPLTATSISLPEGQRATVQYQVTNQSSKTHTLEMTPIKGVAQITTGAGICPAPFTLTGKASCVLSLEINGSEVNNGSTNGPVVCTAGSTLQCYKPSAADILTIAIIPGPPEYTVGGTISGLSGTLILANNGMDAQTITSNGGFTFSNPLEEGDTYNVTIQTQPTEQSCMVTNGSGTMGSSNVTNISVYCSENVTTLSTSISELALAINGNARTITITNTGSLAAENLSIQYPTWPSGTTTSSTCNNTLNASDSCTITITPGANATSDCNTGTGSAPTPGIIEISASNSNSTTSDVVVLAYSCIYQQGYVFAIDDTTPASFSIGSTTVAQADVASDIIWADSGPLCTEYTVDSSGNSPCEEGTCYDNWYLPAICQMVDSAMSCAPSIPNMVTNLSALITGCSGSMCLNGGYWSSTEFYDDPDLYVWLAFIDSTSSNALIMNKNSVSAVRCVRDIS